MAANIAPLTSIMPTPLVRERRQYPGDKQQQKKKPQDKESADDSQTELEEEPDSDSDSLSLAVDIDKKTAKVKHIDDYA